MSNITINEAKRSIEVTKEFYKKASVFGSAEYYLDQGQQWQSDFL